jgi:hypothetical protein
MDNSIPIAAPSVTAGGDGESAASPLFAFNGGGPALLDTTPSGLRYDRLKTLQGRYPKVSVISNTTAGDTSLTVVTSGDAPQISPGIQLWLLQNNNGNLGSFEAVYVSDSYVPTVGVNIVPLKNPVQNSGQNTIWWERFHIQGLTADSAASNMLPDGLIPFALALYNPGSNNRYTVLGNATQLQAALENTIPTVPYVYDSVQGHALRENGNGCVVWQPTGGAITGAQNYTVDNINWRGAVFFLNVTNINAATLAMTIYNNAQNLGLQQSIIATAAIVANGLYTLTVFPGALAVANSVANMILSRQIGITVTGASGSSFSGQMQGMV